MRFMVKRWAELSSLKIFEKKWKVIQLREYRICVFIYILLLLHAVAAKFRIFCKLNFYWFYPTFFVESVRSFVKVQDSAKSMTSEAHDPILQWQCRIWDPVTLYPMIPDYTKYNHISVIYYSERFRDSDNRPEIILSCDEVNVLFASDGTSRRTL
jgi:hypothetical protein